ncbi:Alpha-D-kanosaminyltransferase [Methanosarcinales archaeon]|nr:Alpha-D-kanosaminyltransferase [Methanosarcinales archaeon]
MQIIFTCDVALNDKEAQNIHVIELYNNLSKVANVCLFVPKPRRIKVILSDVKYVPKLGIPELGLLLYQISLFFHLYVYCRKIKVDAIYARQSPFTFIPFIVSNYFKIPYFVEVNGLIADEMKMFGQSKLKIAIAKISEKLGYKKAIKIFAVTQGIKEGIIKLYNIPEEKIVVMGNGANISMFRPIDQEEAKKELKLDTHLRYVCFVGNIVIWQGTIYLVHAAPSILLQCPNTRFLIVGDGPMKSECMQQAEKLGVNNMFIFIGSVPYKYVPLYINASDICIVYKKPIKSGYSPLKLYEYMACEKPVVASRLEGFEIIEQQNAGLLVKPEDPEELAKAVIKLLKDDTLREEMGKNGRKYVVKNHSWEAIGRKTAEIFSRNQ